MWIIAVAVAVLAALFFAVSYAFYTITFYHMPKVYREVRLPRQWLGDSYDSCKACYDKVAAEKYEEVNITAQDGTHLCGKLYMLDPSKPFAMMMHGYKSVALVDFCGGYEMVDELGYNKLIIDQRAHGKSGGHTITFGIRESDDCLSWVKYLTDRFGKDIKIALIGVSMGAATVTMATGRAMPPEVKCVIADCGYSSPKEIIIKVMRDRHIPASMYLFAKTGARIFGGFSVEEYSSAEAVRHSATPILFIHGEADSFVPCDMSRELYAACISQKRLLTVEGAEHAVSAVVDAKAYREAVFGWLHLYMD